MKERIKNLLIGGLKASEVATIVGCTPGYISQLLANQDFKNEIEAGRIAISAEKDEQEHLDLRYQNLEHKLITSISEDLGNADFNQKVRALDVIGRRTDERRKIRLPALAPVTGGNTTYNFVQIGLPAHAITIPTPVVEVNEKSEIIAIDNRPLAGMSTEGVKNIFKRLQEKKRLAAAGIIIDNKTLEEI